MKGWGARANTFAGILIQIVIVVEARTGFAVPSISISTGMVQHPTYDPIISTRYRSLVIPMLSVMTRVLPYYLNRRTEGCIGVLVGSVRGVLMGIERFQLITPALQLLVESVDSFLLGSKEKPHQLSSQFIGDSGLNFVSFFC